MRPDLQLPEIKPAAPSDKRKGAAPAPARRSDFLLPLCFILFGMGALLAAMIWLMSEPEALSAFHYAPHTVALGHLFILGFILSVTIGAVYQLIPVAMETKLAHPTLGLHHFWMHAMGVIGMVISFYSWRMSDLCVYGSLVFLGILLFVFNVLVTLKKAPRFDVVGGFILSAVIWLFLTVTAGLMVASHKQHPFLPWPPLAMLHAHAHLGLIGIFAMIIPGVSLRLVPMFALSEIQSRSRARWTLGLLNTGLPFLVFSLLAESALLRLWASVLLSSGLVVYGVEIRKIIMARKRRQIDWGLWTFFTALMALYLAMATGLLVIWLPANGVGARLESVYALLFIFGFIGLAIIGMLHKILPFLVWFRVYSPHIGKAKLPATGEMFSPTLAAGAYGFLLGGLATGCAGAFLGSAQVSQIGAFLLALGTIAFLLNMGLVFSHLFQITKPNPITR